MRTLLRFLTGDRGAILALAADRRTLWAGLLFVLAAGLAREYDGADLARRPWLLLVPPAASIVVSFLLFALVYARIIPGPDKPRFWPAYRTFLGLFWMTAPLALLYAIPYERFLDPADAAAANLWTLGVVALWRVLLITRVLAVLTGRRGAAMFFVVMLVADAVALVALFVTPLPVIDIMGGVRPTDREQVLQTTAFLTGVFGFLTLPVWLIGAAIVLYKGRTDWRVPAEGEPVPETDVRGLTRLAAASVAVWAAVLPFTQPEQFRRSSVERDLRAGRVVEALATMSAHEPGDFPPHWDPPPRPAYRQNRPPLLDVLEAIVEHGAADWVRAVYVAKLERTYLHYGFAERVDDGRESPAHWARVTRLLDRLPEGPNLRAKHGARISRIDQRLVRAAPGRRQDEAPPPEAQEGGKGQPD